MSTGTGVSTSTSEDASCSYSSYETYTCTYRDSSTPSRDTPSTNTPSSSTVSSYRDYEQEARELVKHIIEQAIETYLEEMMAEKGVKWPTGENFSIEKAEEAIDKLVQTWPVGETWKYCIDYLHQKDNLYCFAVKYSEPTRRRPVPRATASVYFYLVVRNKESPVLVLYVLEGQRSAHGPSTTFHEVWLRNVIRNKLAVTEGLDLMAI